MQNSEFLSSLQWRYATKSFDSTKKLTEEQLQYVLEAFRLSASSFGLQLWKCVVVENPEIRKTLQGHSWGQSQIVDASHLLVFCRLHSVDASHVDSFIADIAQTRGAPVAALEGYANMMKGTIASRDAESLARWMGHQVYLALGTVLSACAVAGIDSCPMEGFDPAKYNEVLGLTEKNLVAQVVLPIGFRSENDTYSQLKKVRYSLDAIVEKI